MASPTVSLLRFGSVALAAAALMLGSVAAGTLDAVKQVKTIRPCGARRRTAVLLQG
jgi:hypothetical protein